MTPVHEHIRDVILPVLQPYVCRIAVFGSVARGEEKPGSDIDILVMLRHPDKRPALGLQWFLFESMLSDKLGRPVELVTEDALSPRIRPYIAEDQVVLYEEG